MAESEFKQFSELIHYMSLFFFCIAVWNLERMTIKMMRTMRNQVMIILMMTVPLMMICTSSKCDCSMNTICKTLKQWLLDDQTTTVLK